MVIFMNKELILEKLCNIISMYISETKFHFDNDIMGYPIFLPAHEMADLFLCIEKEFAVDLNDLIVNLNVFSLNAIFFLFMCSLRLPSLFMSMRWWFR